jgi:energy-coupling factor transport system ATP-binding protein
MIEIKYLTAGFNGKNVLDQSAVLRINSNARILLTGDTGSGKSTLLGILSGLIPKYTGGQVSGSIAMFGSEIMNLKHVPDPTKIGYVFQNPFDSFVQSTVLAEILFSAQQSNVVIAPEWLAEILNALEIAHLVEREVATLSDGEAQRVSIAAALVLRPSFLLLDEPTSALDFESSQNFRTLLCELSDKYKFGFVLSEHRYDTWLEHVDSVWHLDDGRIVDFTPDAFALESGAPIKTREILRLLGQNTFKWRRTDFHNLVFPSMPPTNATEVEIAQQPIISITGMSVTKSEQTILSNINFELVQGEVLAVVGASGSGKSTLLHSIIGDFVPVAGSATIEDRTTASLDARGLLGVVSLVPQQPGQLFVGETVSAECEFADKWRGLTAGSTLLQLTNFDVGIDLATHPRDLSAGQQLWLAIAIALAARPKVLLLDEPTRGLDYVGKAQLLKLLEQRKSENLVTVWATHDIEAAADISTNLILLADGKQVSFGPPTTHHHPGLAKSSVISEILESQSFLSLGQLQHAIGKTS